MRGDSLHSNGLFSIHWLGFQNFRRDMASSPETSELPLLTLMP